MEVLNQLTELYNSRSQSRGLGYLFCFNFNYDFYFLKLKTYKRIHDYVEVLFGRITINFKRYFLNVCMYACMHLFSPYLKSRERKERERKEEWRGEERIFHPFVHLLNPQISLKPRVQN